MTRSATNPVPILEQIRSFRGKRILVFGDVILDQFIRGEVERISPEAPVPVVAVRSEEYRLGGAGNVAANIKALGGVPILLGVIGNDPGGERLLQELERLRIPSNGLLIDLGRPTITKTRVIAGHQQVCRVDREHPAPMTVELFKKAILFLRNHLTDVDAVLVSDYGKGLINEKLLASILPAAQKAGRITAIDPKSRDFSMYSPATVLTPNKKEAAAAARIDIQDDRTLRQAADVILQQTKVDNLLITLGEGGSVLFRAGGFARHLATSAREVYDVTGAGDTVIAVLTLAMSAGVNVEDAAVLANHAAGIVVGKLGTAVVHAEELALSITRMGLVSQLG